MADENKISDRSSTLRERAEERLPKQRGELNKISPADVQRAFHELEVRQIELEMQNEELSRAQLDLEASRQKYFDLYDLAPVGYITLDEKGIILDTNLTAAALLGKERNGVVSQPLSRFIFREDQDIYYHHRKRLFETRQREDCEVRILKRDGTQSWVHMESVAATGKYDEPASRTAIIDITRRKETEETLAKLRHEKELILNTAAEGIFGLDLEGKHTFINLSAAKMLGYKVGELIGRHSHPIWHHSKSDGSTYPASECPIYSSLTDGLIHAVENEVFWRKDGSSFQVSYISAPIMEGDEIKGAVVSFRDITELKRLEEQERLEHSVLEHLNLMGGSEDAILDILQMIKQSTGFEAVGIRLRKDADFPYYVQAGFSADFLRTENTLTVSGPDGGLGRDKDGNISLECTCGLVISGRTDPANPLFTAGGSFWTNDSFPLLYLPSDQDPRLYPRNRCIHEGFHSFALIPLRVGKDIVGLLQLNDRRKDQFTLEMIHFFEGLGSSIGIAL